MEPDRDAILKALENVIDPELRRPVTELDMVRDVEIDGGDVSVTIALTVAGLPAARELPGAGRRARRPGAGRRACPARLRRDEPRGTLGAFREAPRRRRGALEGDLGRPLDSRARGRERQGRRRQVVADREPRRRVRAARPPHGRPRRRHLRPLDPAHARHHAAAGGRRQDDRPAREGRPEADVDRLLPRRQLAGDVARPDAPPGARAVPLRRPLGRARPAARRHAAGHRRRLDLARPAASAGGGGDRHHAAAARPGGRRRARRRWRRRRTCA